MSQTDRRALAFSRAFYACYYAAAACLMPFLALYYRGLGFSGRQIGVLRGIGPVAIMIAAPVWSALADASRRHKTLWLIAIAGSWLGALGLSLASSYAVLIAIVLAQALLGAPVMPLADSAVIGLLGEQRDRYGTQRLWGAVGWGTGGLVIGFVTDHYGLTWSFIGYLGMMAAAGLMAAAIPVTRPASRQRSYRADVVKLVSNRSWLAFLVAALIGGLYTRIEANYLMLYMSSLGAGEGLMGVSIAISTVSEIPIWAVTPYLLRRLGPRGLLSVALVTGTVKGIAFSFAPSAWFILPIQLFNGLAFSTAWTAGVAYAADIAPEGTRATAQALYSSVTTALATMVGAIVAGWFFDTIGGAMTFRLAALTPLVALTILWFGVKTREARREVALKDFG